MHESIASELLPLLGEDLDGVELVGDAAAREILSMGEATEDDWATEFLALKLAVRVVPSIDDAIDHVSRYGSGHSEAIVTTDIAAADRWVREVDAGRRRLSLSLRETAKSDPWREARTKYQDGEVVAGEIEQIAKFGIFVQLEPGLTGLLPFSALGLPEGSNVRRQYHPGQRLEVVVDSIDTKRRRVSLAPIGAKLEGTKADLKAYQRKQHDTTGGGLGAMAAALGKLRPQA